ncbi:hypothetical protein [Flavobacterium sp.]|uniref:hypothetical protein n=1 Tax=Flavobacterium sp. TaxID=239 RepID=UPI00260B7E57|nr:hypothetical protein [Flavobacterium sp.]
MNKLVLEILGKLNEKENLLIKKPFLGAMSMLSNKDISKYKLPKIDRNNYIYIMNTRNEGDLLLGEKYNVIFSIGNPKEYLKSDVEVDYLSMNEDDNIKLMPDGKGGFVGLKFKNEVPEITKFLKQNDDEQFDNNIHSFLFFTTQEVMNKILDELDKVENV